jgi:hypothetical protein
MKTARTFKGSWYLLSMAVAIIVGEVVAWGIADRFNLRANPLTVAFLCIGLVVAFAMVLYEDADIR